MIIVDILTDLVLSAVCFFGFHEYRFYKNRLDLDPEGLMTEYECEHCGKRITVNHGF